MTAASASVPGVPGMANGLASVNCGAPFTMLLVLTVVAAERSARKVAGDVAGVVRVVDAPAAAQDRLARVVQLIGEAEARREVVLVGIAQGAAGAELGRRSPPGKCVGEVGAEELLAPLRSGTTILPVARSKEKSCRSSV